MSSEQPEFKDAPSHVEEKEQELFNRRRAGDEEFVDEKAADGLQASSPVDSEDEKKTFGLRRSRMKLLIHIFLWMCFTGIVECGRKNSPRECFWACGVVIDRGFENSHHLN